MCKVILDAGHGGSDSGNTFGEYKEKDDVLRLALAVGKILENSSIGTEYTRVDDSYNTPYEKSEMANNSDANLFISFHRNMSENPSRSGVESLICSDDGIRKTVADNINKELEKIGFQILGTTKRPNLVILHHTKIPSVLIEVGYISSEKDNQLFYTKFDELASAIAKAVLASVNNDTEIQQQKDIYRVQVALIRDRDKACDLMEKLQNEGYQSFLIFDNDFFKVQVGAYENLDNATKMEQTLRRSGYDTFIATR